MKNKMLYIVLICISFTFNTNCMKKPKNEGIELFLMLPIDTHKEIFNILSDQDKLTMRGVSKDFSKISNNTYIPTTIEKMLKNYFTYPHLAIAHEEIDNKTHKKIIKGEHNFIDYLEKNDWKQSEISNDALTYILQNDMYKKICYKDILDASSAYFNSTHWKNFFKLHEEKILIKSDVALLPILSSLDDICNNMNKINVESNLSINFKKITSPEGYLENKIDMVCIIDLARNNLFKAFLKSVIKKIEEEKKYNSIRLILNTTHKISKNELNEILNYLSNIINTNPEVSKKIKYIDLTRLLRQLGEFNPDDTNDLLEFIEKKENNFPNSIIYIPKMLYLDGLLIGHREKIPGMIPRPDYFNQTINNDVDFFDLLKDLTQQQLQTFLDNGCILDILHFLTKLGRKKSNNNEANWILHDHAELLSKNITFVSTFNHYNILSALIGACAELYFDNPINVENSVIDIIKKIMKDHNINTIEEMKIEDLKDDMMEECKAYLWEFLGSKGIIVPFTAN